MKCLCLLLVMMTAVVLMAANPVARVTSSGPLTLNGKAVPATAVTSLPVVAGDEIATSSSAAMIYFADRSRATIEPNSRVKLAAQSSSLALRVLSGSVDLKMSEGSQISLIEPNSRATKKPAVASASDPASAPAKKLCTPPPPPPRRSGP